MPGKKMPNEGNQFIEILFAKQFGHPGLARQALPLDTGIAGEQDDGRQRHAATLAQLRGQAKAVAIRQFAGDHDKIEVAFSNGGQCFGTRSGRHKHQPTKTLEALMQNFAVQLRTLNQQNIHNPLQRRRNDNFDNTTSTTG